MWPSIGKGEGRRVRLGRPVGKVRMRGGGSIWRCWVAEEEGWEDGGGDGGLGEKRGIYSGVCDER